MSAVEIGSVVIGALLLGFVLTDLFMTVFMVGGGAGPQSRVIADRAWRLALRLHTPDSDRSHSRMRAAGPLIVLLVLFLWVFELVLGWALVFVPTAFAAAQEDGAGASTGFGDRVLFAARSIVGRSGNGEPLQPLPGGWEALNAVAGATGVFLISVGLAYVLPILASVANKRAIAGLIGTLGTTVDDMRRLGHPGGGSSYELHFVSLTSAILVTAERHRAYPVLHYFHSHSLHAALAPAICRLVLLLRTEYPDDHSMDRTVLVPLSRAIQNLFAALTDLGLGDYARERSGVDEGALTHVGMNPESDQPMDGLPDDAWLAAYARFDGWVWETIRDGDSTHRATADARSGPASGSGSS